MADASVPEPISVDEFHQTAQAILDEVGKVIVGQQTVVQQVLMCIVSGGHALLEGVPGLGKTMLIRTLAEVLDLKFSRIQFTPDLMPADIIGTNIMEEGEDGRRTFRFEAGPVFANLVLADEINRATPKTQSALLEAMQEKTVTVANARYPLAPPFFVLATQNPIEMEGTYPLPEAQLDRFLFKVDVLFPSSSELIEIMNRTTGSSVASVRSSAPRRQRAGPPATARNVSPTNGWCARPHSTRSPSFSATSMPQWSCPVMKLRVPSIGSITQVSGERPGSWPCSSPRMPWSGNALAISARITASASRSAAVTGS